MNRLIDIKERQTLYFALKKDFQSAYYSNGRNVELALSQVSQLRDRDKEAIRSILYDYIKQLIK
jgi:hypothetical protein